MAVTSSDIADAIVRVREGDFLVVPGYDGVYGQLLLSKEQLKNYNQTKRVEQKNIFDF